MQDVVNLLKEFEEINAKFFEPMEAGEMLCFNRKASKGVIVMRHKISFVFLMCLLLSAITLPNMAFAQEGKDLNKTLRLHKMWVEGKDGGVKVNLAFALPISYAGT